MLFHSCIRLPGIVAAAFAWSAACIALGGGLASTAAEDAKFTIVALGASQTEGKGVSRDETYPAQLESLLRAKGYSLRVVNAGINGDTTGNMLGRLNSAVPAGTKLVILQPGGNDQRHNSVDATSEIENRLKARGIAVIMLTNSSFHGLPRSDGQHLTAAGYRTIAEYLLPQVERSLRE